MKLGFTSLISLVLQSHLTVYRTITPILRQPIGRSTVITIVFTETHLLAYVNVIDAMPYQLVKAELAGRGHPMTSTLHVFLNSLINRYKDYHSESVRYPIDVNIVFPTQSYDSEENRRHLLQYILDRKDVIQIRRRKSFMEALVRGWGQQNNVEVDQWVAMEISDLLAIGVKPGRAKSLFVKNDPQVGRSHLLQELRQWADQIDAPQVGYLINQIEHLTDEQVERILNKKNLIADFPDSQELPNSEIELDEEFVLNILQITSNRIFLHINNCNSKLPKNELVFIYGSFTDNEAIQSTLREKASNSNFRTVFIPSQRMAQLAAVGMDSDKSYSTTTAEQAQHSTPTNGTSTFTREDQITSSPESSRFTQNTKQRTPSAAKAASGETSFSKEFIVEKRIPDQEFMLFKGHRRGMDIKHLYRYIDQEEYKKIDRAAAFNSVYRKERKLYSKLGTVVNGRSGRYYILPSFKAKPLASAIKQSRLNIQSEKDFKSEDINFILDLYRAVKKLPVTFTNLTANNIYVRRRDWWRRNSQNEFYFLGVNSENSSIPNMTIELDKLLQSLIHPSIIEHIANFKNEI